MMLPQIYKFLTSPLRMGKNWMVNRANPPVIVLIYHRVAPLSSDPQLLAVSPENFSAQMRYLKENFQIIKLDEEWDWSRITRPAVVITFDDGYADNIHGALPILEQHCIPATFFITTGYISSEREFWWDELELLILGEGDYPPFIQLDDVDGWRRWYTSSQSLRRKLYKDMHPLLKGLAPEQRENVLTQLRLWAKGGDRGHPSNRVATLNELRKLAQNPLVTIGAHTISHAPLSILSPDVQKAEMTESKQQLENWLGREINVFSYPFGSCSDYTADTVTLCREAGFIKAVANIPGRCNCYTDPFQMPRNLVRNWGVDVFRRKMWRFLFA